MGGSVRGGVLAHRATGLLVFLVVVAPALAGCVQPDRAPALNDPASAPEFDDALGSIPSLTFSDCQRLFVGPIALPPDSAARFVPPGFTPAAGPTGLPGDLMGIDAMSCGIASGTGFEARDVGYVEWYVPVKPPDRYLTANATNYAVILGHFVSDESLARVYRSWGIETEGNASVDVALDLDTPGARTAHVQAGDRATTLRVDVRLPRVSQPTDDLIGRLFATRSDGAGGVALAAVIDTRLKGYPQEEGLGTFVVSGDAGTFPITQASAPGNYVELAGPMWEFSYAPLVEEGT